MAAEAPEQNGKTARFAAVVKVSGTPEVVYLWTDPRADKSFMSAVRGDRVMTLRQERGASKRDVGVIGFLREKNASYLVFPKPLTAFKNSRIVGIKYDLIEMPGPIGRVVKPEPEHHAPAASTRTPSIAPSLRPSDRTAPVQPHRVPGPVPAKIDERKPRFYQVTMRFTGTVEVSQRVQAASKQAARTKAQERLEAPDLNRGTITRKILKVTKAE